MCDCNEPRANDEQTIFTLLMRPFPDVKDSKINTAEFLEASQGVVLLVDKLGKVFAPVKYDMNGNINKLTAKYEENKTKYVFLEDMICIEQEEGGGITTDALMWLRRGLHFMQRFFQGVVSDGDEKTPLPHLMKIAYAETLEPFHGWMGCQLFNIMCRFSPSRKEFFSILALDEPNKNSIVLNDMSIFISRLEKCVKHLIQFYEEHNLETLVRV